MSTFENTRYLIASVEFYLASEVQSPYRLLSHLQRLIWLPVKFLKIGASEKLKGASVWSFLVFACIMIGAWVVKQLGITGTEAANYVLLLSGIAPLFFMVFAMPSMYGDSGLQSKAVEFVAEQLQKFGLTSTSQIALIRSSVSLYESRVKMRITALKWLVGLLWATFVYTVSKSDRLIMSATAGTFALTVACLLIATVVAYVLVWGYEASVSKLFRAIYFGCDECAGDIPG